MFSKVFKYFSTNFSKDYYKVLGLSKLASKVELRSAYIKLAKQYHPDSPTGDEEKFKELGEAWSVLGNEASKAEYDSGKSSNNDMGSDGYGRSRRDYYSHASDYQKWQEFYQQQYTKKNSFQYDFDEFFKKGTRNQNYESPKGKSQRTEYYEFYDYKTGKRIFYKFTVNDKDKGRTKGSNFDFNFDDDGYKKTNRKYSSINEEELLFLDKITLVSFIFGLVLLYYLIKGLSRTVNSNNPRYESYPKPKRRVWDDFEDDFQKEFNKRR